MNSTSSQSPFRSDLTPTVLHRSTKLCKSSCNQRKKSNKERDRDKMSAFRTPPRHRRTPTPHRPTSYGTPHPSKIDNRAYASSPRSEKKKTPGDRFVPNRASGDIDFARYKIASQFKGENTTSPSRSSPSQREASAAMREKLLSLKGKSSEDRILSFRQTNAISSSNSKTPGKCK